MRTNFSIFLCQFGGILLLLLLLFCFLVLVLRLPLSNAKLVPFSSEYSSATWVFFCSLAVAIHIHHYLVSRVMCYNTLLVGTRFLFRIRRSQNLSLCDWPGPLSVLCALLTTIDYTTCEKIGEQAEEMYCRLQQAAQRSRRGSAGLPL